MYDVGDEAKLTGVFTNRPLRPKEWKTFHESGELPEGAGVDPDEVVCTVVVAGVVSHPSVSNDTPGIYTALWDVVSEEDIAYAFDGTGSFKASGENLAPVRPQAVPRS